MKSISMSRAPRFSACVAMMFALFSAAHIELYAEIANPVTADCTLTSDESVDGILTVNSGVTVNLAGRRLTVKGLAGDGTITGAGTLYVDTAGGSVENSTVALTGGLKLTVGGGGTFTASKASQTYTGGTEAEAGTTLKVGTVTHPFGEGNATQTVTLKANAVFNFNANKNDTTCCYNFALYGGSAIQTGNVSGRWTRHFGAIELFGDATFSADGQALFGGISSVHSTITLNGHVLSVTHPNWNANAGYVKTLDNGTIALTSGGVGCHAPGIDLKTATVEYSGDGWAYLGSDGLSVGNFAYKSQTCKWNRTKASANVNVYGRYLAAALRPPMVMEDGSTLDLSDCEGVWSADGATYTSLDRFVAGLVNFLSSGASYTVDIGTRAVEVGDQLVSFPSSYAPDLSTVSFTLAATGAAQTPTEQEIDVVFRDSGLFVKSTATPSYARYVVGTGWKYFKADGTDMTSLWSGGLTSEMEVRIYSYDEYIAVKAANVSPSRFDICGTIEIPAGVVSLDMTRCFDTLAEGGVIDLNGNSVTIQDFSGAGMITDTSDGIPGELHLATAGGSVENSTIALTGNLRLVVEGGGTFTASKANQSYTGGTEAEAGTTLKVGNATHPFGDGNATQTVTLKDNAVFSFNANKNASTCCYNFILCGGSTISTGSVSDRNNRHFGSLTLLGDATFILGSKAMFGGGNVGNPGESTITLNDNTLAIEMEASGDPNMASVRTLDTGRIVIESGYAGMYNGTAPDFRSALFETADMGFINYGNLPPLLGDFRCAGMQKWYAITAAKPSVYGRYYAGTFRPPLEMKDGSTLDLSEVTGTWSASGIVYTQAKDETAAGRVSFADGAAITVDLSDRTDLRTIAKSENPYIVTWDSQPSATFTLDAASYEEGYRITPDSTGLKVSYHQGLTIIVR